MEKEVTETGCCPKFNPVPWHDKMLEWYTTCPKCAKAYGKNYVVIIAEVTSKE